MAQGGVKDLFFRYLQPGSVVAIVLFWALLPPKLAQDPLVFLIAGGLTPFLILALERFNPRHESWRLTRSELASDLFYVVLRFTLIDWLNRNVADASVVALKETIGLSTPWLVAQPLIVQVVLILFLFEYGQYWLHRGMHNWRPLWLTHAPHHYLTQLNALKGAVGNPVELFLIGLSVLGLLDFSLAALFCAFHLLGTIGSFCHANIRFNEPRWYNFLFTTIDHHSLHHSQDYESIRCNYANCLIVIDRMHGTFRAGASELVGQDGGRKLSIKDVMLFTFQPLIDGARGLLKGGRPA